MGRVGYLRLRAPGPLFVTEEEAKWISFFISEMKHKITLPNEFLLLNFF